MLLPVQASARPLVAVTVPAQAWLVGQVGGEHVDILTLVPDGHVPETARPHPRVLGRLQQADLRFIIGHPSLYFENRYITPLRKNSDQGYWLSMYEIKKEIAPGDNPALMDPHLWTSPSVMVESARRLADALSALDNVNAPVYQRNLVQLEENISKLDSRLRAITGNEQGRGLLVYHPAWGHFCQDYGLHQVAVEEEGKTPGPGNLSALLRGIDREGISIIVSSPGSDQRLAEMIAEQLDIELVLIDPLNHDWMNMMRQMERALEKNQNNE